MLQKGTVAALCGALSMGNWAWPYHQVPGLVFMRGVFFPGTYILERPSYGAGTSGFNKRLS